MKDNEKVELTAGDLRRAAEKCGTAKEVLKTLCPEVFKDEWENVSKECSFSLDSQKLTIVCRGKHIFSILDVADIAYRGGEYKLEDGLIWRRKSQ